MITDRYRHTVIEVNSNRILSRDLTAKETALKVNLSAPSRLSLKIDRGQQYGSAFGIQWKSWGQWIITEMEIDGVQQIVGATIVENPHVDPKTGDMVIDATGFMGYPKGIPWLENFNPIAADPAEVIQRIWAHCQNFVNSNLGVSVLPASTGTQMLPGIAFDGSTLSFDFFALFIRAVDFNDSGDQIISLARDLPLDLFEEATWNEDRTEVNKVLRIAYPLGGVQQDHLSFRYGDNVIEATPADEFDIEPVTDIIVRSWAPGRVINTSLSNSDPTRLRRVMLEEDANINSTERAAAMAKRKLQKRNIPKSFSKITIEPNHINAPLGKFWVGDSIYVEARNFPWVGDVEGWHRITGISLTDTQPLVELDLKVEGAFNYDPIEYDPNYEEGPTEDPNLLHNGYFGRNLAGWYSRRGQWFRVNEPFYGEIDTGSVRIDCDDAGERFESHKVSVTAGEALNTICKVQYREVTSTGSVPGFILRMNLYKDGGFVSYVDIDSILSPASVAGWQTLEGVLNIPSDGSVNEASMEFNVDASVTGGTAFWTYARILR